MVQWLELSAFTAAVQSLVWELRSHIKPLPAVVKKQTNMGVPFLAQWLVNLARNQEVAGSIPGLAQWIGDPELLWLWRRQAATAPVGPLTWESPCAAGAALKRTKRKQKKKCLKNKQTNNNNKTNVLKAIFPDIRPLPLSFNSPPKPFVTCH